MNSDCLKKIIFIFIIFLLFSKARLKTCVENNINENFSFYSFKCITNNKFSYINDIYEIKNFLEKDKFIITKPYECEKLLNLYDVIICDLKKNNLDSLEIINFLTVKEDDNKFNYINNIFLAFKTESDILINNISNFSDDTTLKRYLNPNINIIENIKNEFFMKFLN